MVSTLTMPLFQGTFTALLTPFRNDEIDEPALRALVEFQIANGVDGLVPCGTTGESSTMSDAERERVIEIVIDQTDGRVPVVAGTGSNDTRRTIEATRRADRAGADAALVVVPYYNKPTQAGLIAHYTAVAESCDLPILLYNVPGRTAINMAPETTIALATLPNVAGIKDAGAGIDQISEIVAGVPDRFSIFSSDDSLTVPMMSVGARGVISVLGNIMPGAMAALTSACLRDDFAAARQLHVDLYPLMRAMFIENNPTAVKAAASLLGLCTDEVRLPLVPLTASNRLLLEQLLTATGVMRQSVAA